MKYSILIVEDHALTRFGLRTAFETGQNFSEILEAPNAKTALEIVKKKHVDAVIMDLGLPDMTGIEATKIIKEKHPSTKIIILSSHEKEEEVIKSLRAGANAYCTKDIAPEKLIETTESVLKGAAWFDPKVAQYVLNLAGKSSPQETQPGSTAQDASVSAPAKPLERDKSSATGTAVENINLTARERQVLALIAEGMSNNEIAKTLEVSINTTKVHVCNILQKLGVSDRTQAAIKAYKENII